ncbi:MAG: FAD-dependent oxidoreductase, partial [Sphingomicrobium sp.]
WVARASYDDIAAMAREELGALLGCAFRGGIHRRAVSGWKDDPLFGGSYSYARPGQHGARRQLAEPVADRIAFAGEACSEVDFSTVHGAWESGIAAVEKLFGEFHDAH